MWKCSVFFEVRTEYCINEIRLQGVNQTKTFSKVRSILARSRPEARLVAPPAPMLVVHTSQNDKRHSFYLEWRAGR
jgi:hypothetical protein